MPKIYKGQTCYTEEEARILSEKHIHEQAEILRNNIRAAKSKEATYA